MALKEFLIEVTDKEMRIHNDMPEPYFVNAISKKEARKKILKHLRKKYPLRNIKTHKIWELRKT